MKKKIFTFFLALVASVGTIFASNTQVDGIWYDFDSSTKTASVTYRGKSPNSSIDEYLGNVVIPASVTYNAQTYCVTSIGDHAFYGNSGLTSVTIGNSVTSIGQHAFWYCTGLTSVTIPNSVTSIGADAFYKCSGLTSVTIGNSVTSIGNQAFYECSGLTSVTIGNSVTSIGNQAFYGCKSLTSVTIPNSVTSIGGGAFGGCSGLTSPIYNAHVFAYMPTSYSGAYTIPNGIESIAGSAFYHCTGLTSVTISNSVTSIEGGAFRECTGLTSVTIGNSVTCIGEKAFSSCSGLTSVTIPNSVTSIGYQAFNQCSGLTSVTIGNSVTSIGNYAFSYCRGLTSITIEAETPPTLVVNYSLEGGFWFGDVDYPIYVPCNAVNTYKSKWISYANWIRGNCASYTITFKNWDGSVLQSTQVEEGQMPQYTGATPTKPDDAQYTYTFSGWTPQIVAATADATYTATFAATKLPTEECGVNDTWLQTGGSGLGEITTDNSGIWTYENRYGACAMANSGETGWLLTPAKDLRGMKSVNLSFLHVHKNAGTFTDDMTLWVCANYKGSVSASQWQQLTITPYSTNNNWAYVNVSIDVPLNMVGANTVFGFKYISSNSSAKWEIKELNLNAECAKADETTTTDVTATPNEDNSVTLTWPAVNGADTYTIEIKKNGVSVCTLVFNANGQLISINFAAPARDGKGRNVPAAEQSANGWTYIVTGLEGNTSYTYSVTAKDVNGNVLLKQSVDFSTGVAQGIEDVLSDQVQCTKVIREGQIFILRGDKTYTLTGQETIMP